MFFYSRIICKMCGKGHQKLENASASLRKCGHLCDQTVTKLLSM